MNADTLQEILENHKKWRAGNGGCCADLCRADLCGANLYGANLFGADLCGAKINWNSHHLLSELLWRESDTPEREQLAAWIGRKIVWCWVDWLKQEHAEKDWALGLLRKWAKDDPNAPAALKTGE